MADIRAFLKTKGYTDEELAGMPAKLLNDLADVALEAENGLTARQRAEAIKADLEQSKSQWNEYVLKSDARAAAAEAEVAKQKTYLETLKAQGYQIPDAYLSSEPSKPLNAPGTNAPAAAPAPRDPDKVMSDYFRANIALNSAAARYTRLTGDYLDLESEYADFEKSRRPDEGMTSYLDRKYDLTAKAAAKEAEKKKAYEDGLRAEGRKAAQEEYAKNYGTNPETRIPVATERFAPIRSDESRAQSWNRARAVGNNVTDSIDRRRIEKYATGNIRRETVQ